MELAGKGFYIWKIPECEGGDNEKIAFAAYHAGLSHVIIKIANGIYDYNYDTTTKKDLIEPLADELIKKGIKVWGWHYVFGDLPKEEAKAAIRQINKLPLEGYVIDAESDYKGKYTPAYTFMNELRNSLPDFPMAVSSYRYPKYHSDLPWKNFLTYCDYCMPQVYWEQAHNPAEQLAKCLNEFETVVTPYRPLIPTGPAYGGSGWYPTSAEILEFMNKAITLNMTGVNFWSWDYCRKKLPDLWTTIAEFAWPGYPNPARDIVEILVEAFNDRNIDTIVNLYASDAVHINADRTIQGHASLKTWYTDFLNNQFSSAEFEVTELSQEDSTRYLSWEATFSDGTVKSGSDTIGISNNKIIYHYSSIE
jgi:hypothetical protein